MLEFQKKLNQDLFFCSTLLSRILQKIGKEEFGAIGLSPPYAYILLIVNKFPGVGQHEIRELMWLASSTITRFVKNLENRGYLIRSHEGKFTYVYPTELAQESNRQIELIWSDLKVKYQESQGEKYTKKITNDMFEMTLLLGKDFKVI